MSIDEKIKAAIARGQEACAARLKTEAQTALEEKAKREAETKRFNEARREACEEWIEYDLPKLIEDVTASGSRYVDLAKTSIIVNHYPGALDLLAEICKEVGLDVETTRHDVPESNDLDYRHDAYTYLTHRLKW